jgi:Uma2 family endonuclease
VTTSISKLDQTAPETAIPQWQPATWEDYLFYRDDPGTERTRVFFYREQLFVEIGNEGINHSIVSDLFTVLFAFWFSSRQQVYASYGRCVLEKPRQKAGAPDLVIYVGDNFPRWQSGEPRRINLDQWRVPDLVGEISDTSLATDLDEKKQLYAELGIPEYWVVNVQGNQVFAFQLQEGRYQQCDRSLVLKDLPIVLLEQTLTQLTTQTNGSAALWFQQQIQDIR